MLTEDIQNLKKHLQADESSHAPQATPPSAAPAPPPPVRKTVKQDSRRSPVWR